MHRTIVKLLSLGTFVLTFLLMATACDSGPVADVPEADHVSAETQTESGTLSSLRFTGRDSFGVAFKAKVSGTAHIEQNGGCDGKRVVLVGSGQATHLGRVQVEQSHCDNPESETPITDGRFKFVGRTGAVVAGTYETPAGEGSPPRIRMDIDYTDLPLTRGAERFWGWAWLPELLPSEGPFSYRFDGYLAFI